MGTEVASSMAIFAGLHIFDFFRNRAFLSAVCQRETCNTSGEAEHRLYEMCVLLAEHEGERRKDKNEAAHAQHPR